VSLSLDRSEAQGGDFDETDVRRFDSLRPFLRNALLLRALWREAGCPSGDPAEFVQSLRSAALVLKKQGHAEPLNEAAERKLSQRARGRIDLTQGTLERMDQPAASAAAAPLRSFLQKRFGLTPTQSAIACALVDGLSYSEIAEEYEISRSTVHSHVKAIHEKAGVRSTLRFIALLSSLRHE
jgi:DNA-binding NarL/FixJ family response regulator